MKVTHLIWNFELGGIQRLIVNLIKGRMGEYDISVVGLGENGPSRGMIESAGARTRALEKRPGPDFRAVLRLRKALRDEAPDTLHIHNQGPLVYAAWLPVFRSGKKVVFTLHSPISNSKSLMARLVKRALGNVDELVAVGESVGDNLKRFFDITRDVKVIPNGLFPIERDSAGAARLREKWLIPPGVPLVGFVGRLVENKRVDILLEAASIAVKSGFEAIFLIVGDGPEMANLRDRVKSLGIENNVRFAGEIMDVEPVFSALDVLVLPSRSEGLPMTVIEAMSAGVPVIASNNGGNQAALFGGKGGIIVPGNDPSDYTREIIRLLSDQELCRRISEEGRQLVAKRNSMEAMVRAYEALYGVTAEGIRH